MCGRIACTLSKCDVSRACCVQSSNGQYTPVQWLDTINTGYEYKPVYNLTPSAVTPVLLSNKHFPHMENSTGQFLCGMPWGLVPHWKVDVQHTSSDFKLNNCRAEGIMDKTSFKIPFIKGQRCVVIADGFYEWQKLNDSKEKQPYFIYFNDSNLEVKVNERKWGEEELNAGWWDETTGWQGPRLLTMAGIFDINEHLNQEDPVFTFSVITVAAHKSFSQIHHRMPAVLTNDDEVRRWLYSEETTESLRSLLRPTDCLSWYPVGSIVGNSRNNTRECLNPVSAFAKKNPTPTKSSKSLTLAAKGTPSITKFFSLTPKQNSSQNVSEEEKVQCKKAKLE